MLQAILNAMSEKDKLTAWYLFGVVSEKLQSFKPADGVVMAAETIARTVAQLNAPSLEDRPQLTDAFEAIRTCCKFLNGDGEIHKTVKLTTDSLLNLLFATDSETGNKYIECNSHWLTAGILTVVWKSYYLAKLSYQAPGQGIRIMVPDPSGAGPDLTIEFGRYDAPVGHTPHISTEYKGQTIVWRADF